MVSAVVAKVLGAVFKIPLTNVLGGIGMSYFSCAYSLFMPVYALTVTGLSSAVARMTAQSAVSGMYRNALKVRRIALLLFSGAGLMGSLLILLLAKPFSIYSVSSPEASAAVMMIAPAVFFGCITAVERGYYEGMSNMYPTAFSQVAEGVIKAGAGLFLCGYVTEHPDVVLRYFPYVTDVRAAAAAAGILGVTASTAGAALFFGVIRLFEKNPRGSDTKVMSGRHIARELTATALPVGVSAVVTNLTALIDMWTVIGCISYFGSGKAAPVGVSADELPHFVYGSFAGIALTVFNLVPSVTNMLGKGTLTCMTTAHESGDRTALEQGSMQALLTSVVISVPAAVGLFVFAPEILGILYPRQSDEAAICVSSLRYLMAGMVFLCVSYPLFSMLQAVGKPSAPLKIMLVGTGVKLAGNLLLIPFMGVDGAALSTTICYGVILVLSVRIFTASANLRLKLLPFIKIAYAGAMCGGAAYLTSVLLQKSEVSVMLRLAFAGATGGIVYLILLVVLIGRTENKKCGTKYISG